MSRTVHDWLKHARSATDAAEVARCLDEATQLAASFYDLRALLAGVAPLDPARVAAIADRTLEAAVADREVWGFRDVAAARAILGDQPGARAALAAGFELFRQPEQRWGGTKATPGYQWVLLGQGFSTTLNDADGFRQCLEAGLASARAACDADDLVSIASEWAVAVDRATGVALLREAEEMASTDTSRPWTFANAWKALGEAEEARRVLDTALAEATTCSAAVHVLNAWSSHEMPDEARAAGRRAAELARTADEWLALAEALFDARLGDDAIRDAIARAEALADEDAIGRVSTAYKVWLRDDEAAARVGPRGVRPEDLRPRLRVLDGWESSAAALFDALRARAGLEVLTTIARADYGMDADKHLGALRDICETGLVPRVLAWEPHEVLALTRWSSGESIDHLERALACVLLCLAPSDLDELVTNGPILAESCVALGADIASLAESFFAWCAETEDEPLVARLLLFLLRAAARPDDPRTDALSRAILEAPMLPEAKEWIAGSLRADLWKALFERNLAPLASHAPIASVLSAFDGG